MKKLIGLYLAGLATTILIRSALADPITLGPSTSGYYIATGAPSDMITLGAFQLSGPAYYGSDVGTYTLYLVPQRKSGALTDGSFSLSLGQALQIQLEDGSKLSDISAGMC